MNFFSFGRRSIPSGKPQFKGFLCHHCGARKRDSFSGWLVQKQKFYCPDCRPKFLQPLPDMHLYRFHPITGEHAEHGVTVPEKGQAYWSKHGGEFARVELLNFRSSFELVGAKVITHEDRVAEILPEG